MPFITHPVATAKILFDTGGSEDMICAALLHDVIEDCNVTKKQLEELFGKRIAMIVWLLSKVKEWPTSSLRVKNNLEEMENALAEYPEAMIVKMADRLHNIQTLSGFFSLEKQQDYLMETRELLLPVFRRVEMQENIAPYLPTIEKLLKRLSLGVESQSLKVHRPLRKA